MDIKVEYGNVMCHEMQMRECLYFRLWILDYYYDEHMLYSCKNVMLSQGKALEVKLNLKSCYKKLTKGGLKETNARILF